MGDIFIFYLTFKYARYQIHSGESQHRQNGSGKETYQDRLGSFGDCGRYAKRIDAVDRIEESRTKQNVI